MLLSAIWVGTCGGDRTERNYAARMILQTSVETLLLTDVLCNRCPLHRVRMGPRRNRPAMWTLRPTRQSGPSRERRLAQTPAEGLEALSQPAIPCCHRHAWQEQFFGRRAMERTGTDADVTLAAGPAGIAQDAELQLPRFPPAERLKMGPGNALERRMP